MQIQRCHPSLKILPEFFSPPLHTHMHTHNHTSTHMLENLKLPDLQQLLEKWHLCKLTKRECTKKKKKLLLNCVLNMPLSYLEAQNDCPNEAKCKTIAAIHNVMCSHVLQMNSLFVKESQGFVHIL